MNPTPSDSAPRRVLLLGDGGWGTALALTLGDAGHDVGLWSHDPVYARELATRRENVKFLPGVPLPPSLRISADAAELARGADAIFSVIPTQHLRAAAATLAGALPPEVPVVSCSKGIEKGTFDLPSAILRGSLAGRPITVLSGPSHAEEVARRLPTTVVVASPEAGHAQAIQNLFRATHLRVYSSDDVIGVELGGALKNVIAIASGISDGLGFGDNSRAAIVTRGLVEITRLGVALGARRETFSGLSGMGDLITTCTSRHSRNWNTGYRIGQGERLDAILGSTSMVAEGVETSRSLYQLNRRVRADLPISTEVYRVLYEGKSPREAVSSLMSRSTKQEIEDLL